MTPEEITSEREKLLRWIHSPNPAHAVYADESVRRLCKELSALRAERDRLQAIVDKLLKTADGVTIVPGMKVFESADPVREGGVTTIQVNGVEVRYGDAICFYEGKGHISKLYSTKAAALAAHAKEGK